MTQLQIGDAAPDFTLKNSQGDEIILSNLWQTQPVLLTFLRHFG